MVSVKHAEPNPEGQSLAGRLHGDAETRHLDSAFDVTTLRQTLAAEALRAARLCLYVNKPHASLIQYITSAPDRLETRLNSYCGG